MKKLEQLKQLKQWESEVDQGVVIDEEYNFYAKDNVLYDERQYANLAVEFEPDYIYIDPTIKVINKNYILLINDIDEQYEVLKIEDGYYLSLQVSHDLKEIVFKSIDVSNS